MRVEILGHHARPVHTFDIKQEELLGDSVASIISALEQHGAKTAKCSLEVTMPDGQVVPCVFVFAFIDGALRNVPRGA